MLRGFDIAMGYFEEQARDFVENYDLDELDLGYSFALRQGKYLDRVLKKIKKSKCSENRIQMITNFCNLPDFLELFFSPFKEELGEKILAFITNQNVSDSSVGIFLSSYDGGLKLIMACYMDEYYEILKEEVESYANFALRLSEQNHYYYL